MGRDNLMKLFKNCVVNKTGVVSVDSSMSFVDNRCNQLRIRPGGVLVSFVDNSGLEPCSLFYGGCS